MPRVALATCALLPELDEDGPALRVALDRLGIASEPAVWDDPAVDWSSYELVVVRSTWDYTDRRDDFVAWAETVGRATRLANPAPVIAWNTDKRYLQELADAGVGVVPTSWLTPGERLTAPDREFVVKPTVSAGAAETARYRPHEVDDAREHVQRLHDEGGVVMVQPYLDAVDTHGETALIYLGGQFSHAVRKGQILFPGQGVQPIILDNDEREQMTARQATAAERSLADQVLAAAPGPLLFARVDLVPGPAGEPVLLELELTEPSLFLGYAEGAADRLAAAVGSALNG